MKHLHKSLSDELIFSLTEVKHDVIRNIHSSI